MRTVGAGDPPNNRVSTGWPTKELSTRSATIAGTLGRMELADTGPDGDYDSIHPPAMEIFSCFINLMKNQTYWLQNGDVMFIVTSSPHSCQKMIST
jgi:hypothetical protein